MEVGINCRYVKYLHHDLTKNECQASRRTDQSPCTDLATSATHAPLATLRCTYACFQAVLGGCRRAQELVGRTRRCCYEPVQCCGMDFQSAACCISSAIHASAVFFELAASPSMLCRMIERSGSKFAAIVVVVTRDSAHTGSIRSLAFLCQLRRRITFKQRPTTSSPRVLQS